MMNMEPATFATLPPLDEGVEDKLIFLRGADMQDGPLRADMMLPGWYERVKNRIESEMPAFLHFLIEEFEVPTAVKDPKQRFPTCSFKEHVIMMEIADGSPENNLIHRFDGDAHSALFGGDLFEEVIKNPIPWEGGVDALYDLLSVAGSRASQSRFSKTCPNSRVLLSQLRTLKRRMPGRVAYSRDLETRPNKKNGLEYWIIFPKGKDSTKRPSPPQDFAEVDLEDLL